MHSDNYIEANPLVTPPSIFDSKNTLSVFPTIKSSKKNELFEDLDELTLASQDQNSINSLDESELKTERPKTTFGLILINNKYEKISLSQLKNMMEAEISTATSIIALWTNDTF